MNAVAGAQVADGERLHQPPDAQVNEARRRRHVRYRVCLGLALAATVIPFTCSRTYGLPDWLASNGTSRDPVDYARRRVPEASDGDDIHKRPEGNEQPPRYGPGFDSGKQQQRGSKNGKDDPSRANNSPWAWADAGGELGLSGDWVEALRPANFTRRGDGATGNGGDLGGMSIRGDRCSSEASQDELRQILDRRRKAHPKDKVAICVRTKDFGRYLPEWIAHHYVIGVDEIHVYDDESVDNTRELLRPFEKAGIATYVLFQLRSRSVQMKPLNECLLKLMRRRAEDPAAPRWVMFHDMDEYIYPEDTSLTVVDALRRYGERCCVQVERIQYGSSGYRETPRGLTTEMFLWHAAVEDKKHNRLPKVVVNLEPGKPGEGTLEFPLLSMHTARGCNCQQASPGDLRINHYLGSIGDFMDKNRRYWKENRGMGTVEKYMMDRDVNDRKTDTISHWACATREILARVVDGLDLHTGQPLSGRRTLGGVRAR